MRGSRRAPDQQVLRKHFEKSLVGLGLVTPTSAAPQLYNIYVLKHVAGLSTVTIGTALLMSVMWTAYGFIEDRKPVWAVNGVWAVLNAATLVGVVTTGGFGH